MRGVHFLRIGKLQIIYGGATDLPIVVDNFRESVVPDLNYSTGNQVNRWTNNPSAHLECTNLLCACHHAASFFRDSRYSRSSSACLVAFAAFWLRRKVSA